jgi:hypothetical protein
VGGRLRLFGATLLVALGPPLFAACDPPPADRPPDLRMARLADISLENTTDGRRLLRFTTVIVNVGRGAFEVHGSRSAGASTMAVDQRVFDEGGGSRDLETTASMYFSGDGHNHWHVRDFESYELVRRDNGRRVGTGAKHGFCFWDNTPFQLSLPSAPQSPVYRGCGVAGDTRVTIGLSVGWGDRYGATIPDQYIDVTGPSPGGYRLTATADAAGWFLEADDGNNATWVDLRIGRHKVDIEGYGPSA